MIGYWALAAISILGCECLVLWFRSLMFEFSS